MRVCMYEKEREKKKEKKERNGPAAVDDDVTKGYVPKSTSNRAALAPSASIVRPDLTMGCAC